MFSYYVDEKDCVKNYFVEYKEYFTKLPLYPAYYGNYNCSKNFFTERENMPELVLLYTFSGCGYIKYHGEEAFIPKNHLAIIKCSDYQYYKTSSDENWHWLFVHFDGKCADDYEYMLNGNGLKIVCLDGVMDFCSIFDRFLLYNNSINPFADMYSANLLNSVFTDVIAVANDEYTYKFNSKHVKEIEEVIVFMKDNCSQPLTVVDFCGRINISEFHFIKIFKSITNTTPYKYLTNIRITKAKRLLLETALPISEIAVVVGFSDSKNFICAFKKSVSMTPLQFRKNINIVNNIHDDLFEAEPESITHYLIDNK